MKQQEPVSEQSLIADDPSVTPWADARKRLENPQKYRTYWLATVHPEGRPNVMPVIGLWLDSAFYFISGEATRKGRNLAGNPHCVVTVGSPALPALDLVIEGEAVKVTDVAKLKRVAAAYESELHWPLTVRDGAMFGPGAPTAGPPPYALFELCPTTILGLPGLTGMDKKGNRRKDPISPTRWRF
jgi:Pyridoxamine 5'-phosphate oxidase